MTRQGFTLIELLIVVAIIGILAAIAIPNFLMAQVRAKVSRCVADMHSLTTGTEMYRVDNNYYPLYGQIRASGEVQYPAMDNINAMTNQTSFMGYCLTTPVAFIRNLFVDPFTANARVQGMSSVEGDFHIKNYDYLNMPQHIASFGGSAPPFAAELIPFWGQWRMAGAGPDGDRGIDIKRNVIYDPTNGTVSDGDIVRCQKYPQSIAQPNAP